MYVVFTIITTSSKPSEKWTYEVHNSNVYNIDNINAIVTKLNEWRLAMSTKSNKKNQRDSAVVN